MEEHIKALKAEQSALLRAVGEFRAEDWLPARVGKIKNHQTDLPRIAKNKALVEEIEKKLPKIPTRHDLYNADARKMDFSQPTACTLS